MRREEEKRGPAENRGKRWEEARRGEEERRRGEKRREERRGEESRIEEKRMEEKRGQEENRGKRGALRVQKGLDNENAPDPVHL